MKRITEYISETQTSNVATVKQLRQLIDRYPYYQVARLLLLRSMHDTQDPDFSKELRRTALYLPSRAILYQYIEADRLRREFEKIKIEKPDVETAADQPQDLIDEFLTKRPVEEKQPVRRQRPVVDASSDYVEYMLQIEADSTQEEATSPSQTFGQTNIDQFLEQGKLSLNEHPEEELQKPNLENASVENNEVMTETLARIYIKQGKYDSAIEIIRRLSLKYPKKNRYFADQIRFLEKLIVNNNNK